MKGDWKLEKASIAAHNKQRDERLGEASLMYLDAVSRGERFDFTPYTPQEVQEIKEIAKYVDLVKTRYAKDSDFRKLVDEL